MTLFNSEKTHLQLPNAELIYIPNFYNKSIADVFFNNLFKDTDWQHDDIRVFGKTYKQPRLTALYGSTEKSYSYSNITMYPKKFTALLEQIKNEVELIAETTFNIVLLNLYRDGQDSNGWHADNEKELGTNPVIASVSFGEERPFHFKHRKLLNEKYKLILNHGSLLIMKGEMQHHWLHQIAKTKQSIQPRINLTFRYIK
ncbi:alpha-ketoglutarate-dependent dioxygenase AlkB family protein [Paucihalobacter sp.]|uniref:alpha-ketoglutarate-dependent dioxygenase AlkB family protein n=1 Tax=Paucihalobacter sp. TaxID=2850405 RepID=UPI002FE2F34E